MFKQIFCWTIIGGDRIVLRILRLRRMKIFSELGKIFLLFYKSQMSLLYLLIIVFPTFDPLTATVMALYRKMSSFI